MVEHSNDANKNFSILGNIKATVMSFSQKNVDFEFLYHLKANILGFKMIQFLSFTLKELWT